MFCRLILGDTLYVKAVLGMPNVALHALATEGYDSNWCLNASSWPAATPVTGECACPVGCQQVHSALASWHSHLALSHSIVCLPRALDMRYQTCSGFTTHNINLGGIWLLVLPFMVCHSE